MRRAGRRREPRPRAGTDGGCLGGVGCPRSPSSFAHAATAGWGRAPGRARVVVAPLAWGGGGRARAGPGPPERGWRGFGPTPRRCIPSSATPGPGPRRAGQRLHLALGSARRPSPGLHLGACLAGAGSPSETRAQCSKEATVELNVTFVLCGGPSWLTCKVLASPKLEVLLIFKIYLAH